MTRPKGPKKTKLMVYVPDALYAVYARAGHDVSGGLSALVTWAMVQAVKPVWERVHCAELWYGDVVPVTLDDLKRCSTPLIDWETPAKYPTPDEWTDEERERQAEDQKRWYERHNRYGANEEEDLWEREPDSADE